MVKPILKTGIMLIAVLLKRHIANVLMKWLNTPLVGKAIRIL